jgi:uncharacterized membrane protein (DUF373 family)
MIFKKKTNEMKKFDSSMNGAYCGITEFRILGYFEKLLNVLIFILLIALTLIIFKELYQLFAYEFFTADVKELIDSVLFVFILIELFTILFSYLKKGYIKVERIVEVGIISLVRDVIFHISSFEIMRIFGIAALFLTLGFLFYIEKYFSKNRNK